MKITIFGATGNMGNLFLEKIYDEAHEIRILVRNPVKFKHHNKENIKVIQGDATNDEDVLLAIADSDLVVFVLVMLKKYTLCIKRITLF